MVKRSKTLIISAILAGFYLFAGMVLYLALPSDVLQGKLMQRYQLYLTQQGTQWTDQELEKVNSHLDFFVELILDWLRLHLGVWAAGFAVHFIAIWRRMPILALLAGLIYAVGSLIGFPLAVFSAPIVVFTFVGRRNQRRLYIN